MGFGSVVPVLPSSSRSERIMLQNRIRALNHEIRKVNGAVSAGAISRSEGKVRKVYLEGRKADLTNNLARIRYPKVTYKPLKKYVSTTDRPDSSYATSVRPSRNQADYSATPVFDYSTGRMKPVRDTDLPGLPVLKPMDLARENDIRQARARGKAKQLAQQNKIAQLEKRDQMKRAIAEAGRRSALNQQKAINRKRAAEARQIQQMDLQFKKKAQQKKAKKATQKKLNKFVAKQMKTAQTKMNKKKAKASQANLNIRQLMSQRKTTREQHQTAEDAIIARQRADAVRFKAYAQAREAKNKDREVKRFMHTRGR